MRFYIFANDKDASFTVNTSDAIYDSDDYFSTRTQFDIINKEFKYRNCYLVADLNVQEFEAGGMFNKKPVVNLNKDNIFNNDFIPYFIVGEFHYDEDELSTYYNPITNKFDPDLTIRHDTTYIQLNGFQQRFTNNQSALVSYINFVNNSYMAKFFIKLVIYKDSIKKDLIMDRLLGVANVTKRLIAERSFARIELPERVLYYPAEFEYPAPKLFDLKNDSYEAGAIHLEDERPLEVVPL